MGPDTLGSPPESKTSTGGHKLILGECKWTLAENERKGMAELVEQKAAKIIPAHGNWKVNFLGFSRRVWTPGARTYQEEINQPPVQGENWVSTGMRHFTLDELDQDLTRRAKLSRSLR